MASNKYDIQVYPSIRGEFSFRHFIWLALVIVFFVCSFGFAKNVAYERVLYQVVLFITCVTPYFLLAHKPRYRLLVLFSLFYYVMFGLLDYIQIFVDQTYHLFPAFLGLKRSSRTDLIIIFGLMSLMIGYLIAAMSLKSFKRNLRFASWKYRPSIRFALICWSIGISTQFVVKYIYWIKGPSKVSLISHLISNLSYLAILGGMIMVIIVLSKRRTSFAVLLLGFMMTIEIIFGFFANSKEISFRLLALLLIVLFLLKGKVYFRIVLAFLLIFIVYYGAFKVYRHEIIQFQNITPLEVVKKSESVLNKLCSQVEKRDLSVLDNVFFLLDRVDGRKYVELIVRETGHKVKYLKGRSLLLYFYSFIPKMLWPQKPQISMGQYMNQTFHISKSPLTFVPPTQIGEFYWNFGWFGVLLGMAFIGMMLGLINRMFLGSDPISTVGILVCVAASYFLILRFEAGFASQYSHFTRVLIMIWFINTLFSRLGWCESR